MTAIIGQRHGGGFADADKIFYAAASGVGMPIVYLAQKPARWHPAANSPTPCWHRDAIAPGFEPRYTIGMPTPDAAA